MKKAKKAKKADSGFREIKPGEMQSFIVPGRPDQYIVTEVIERDIGSAVIVTLNEVVYDKDGVLDTSEDKTQSMVIVSKLAMKIYVEMTNEKDGNPQALIEKHGKAANKAIKELIDKGFAFHGTDTKGRPTVEVNVFDDIPQ